ncbi:hypothetical protein MX989_08935 [Enterobacter sichuanensis]|uniref:Uncharacterized protein n=1 Tax=Enterobacter sichuanensis TaxID=2071710 RepID=A0AAE4DVI7_9ENTR|nr:MULTISPECIES: hypothetical protein [Enterobacter cloacae complex]MDR9946203.1 hypothetical protein [Enterobacter sichuanensis]
MKLFEMEGFLRGKCLPGDMKVNETNAEYLVRKFAEADAKCAALAAENAGLNAFVDALLSIAWQGGSSDGAEIQDLALKHGLLHQEVYSSDEHETLVDDPGNFEDGDPVYFRVETQATDAFLAEVRAQGVEMFAAWNDKHIKKGVDHKESLTAVSHAARGFAALLRKGVQS